MSVMVTRSDSEAENKTDTLEQENVYANVAAVQVHTTYCCMYMSYNVGPAALHSWYL